MRLILSNVAEFNDAVAVSTKIITKEIGTRNSTISLQIPNAALGYSVYVSIKASPCLDSARDELFSDCFGRIMHARRTCDSYINILRRPSQYDAPVLYRRCLPPLMRWLQQSIQASAIVPLLQLLTLIYFSVQWPLLSTRGLPHWSSCYTTVVSVTYQVQTIH